MREKRRNPGQKKRIAGKSESTKWFYLQIQGWCGKMRRCIGIKVLYCFLLWCLCVSVHLLSHGRSLFPPVSRFNRFKSTLSSSQLPSPLLSFSAFCHPKWYEKERRGGLWRKLIHILSQAISWVQMLLCSRPLEWENG